MAILIEPSFNFPTLYEDPIRLLVNNKEISNFTFFSGRNSGKSYNIYQIALIMTFNELNNNVLIFRASKTQIRDSSFALMSNLIYSNGLEQYFTFRNKLMQIENLASGSIIYFDGIDEDPEKIKGFTPRLNKLAMVIYEEFTEMSSEYPISVANETLIRYKGSDSNGGTVKFIKLGNPSRWNAHWSWDSITIDKTNPKTRVYSPIWEDIRDYLLPNTIDYIENLKLTNNRYYKWAYEGKRMSYDGLVYEHFGTELMRSISDFDGKIPISLICGLDPASKRDKTAFVISILFNTGELFIHDMWMHNPRQQDRQPMSPSEQGSKIIKFLNDWLRKPENGTFRFIPRFMVVDPASGGLDVEIRNNYGSQINVINVPNKNRVADIARNQNAMATKRITFNKYNDNLKPLFDELTMMIWREKAISKELKNIKSTLLTIGEDDCHDAMTYLTNFALTDARFMQYQAELLNIKI